MTLLPARLLAVSPDEAACLAIDETRKMLPDGIGNTKL